MARLITMTAAAPSEICDALPAVIVPSFENAGRRAAERLGGGAGAHAFVGVDHDRVALALRDRDRRDLVGEAPFLLRGGGALVALGRELVLRLAGDVADLADVLLGAAPMCTASNAHHKPSLIIESTTSLLPMRYPARAPGRR